MAADISLRVFTGAGAATMSGPQSGIELSAQDVVSGGSDVLPGTVSYERWIALRLDTAPVVGVTTLSVLNDGDLPTGVTLKFGVTDTPRTPINTVSDIATMDLTSGRKFIFDTGVYDEVGQITRYLVVQEVVAVGAPSGAIPQQELSFGYQEV